MNRFFRKVILNDEVYDMIGNIIEILYIDASKVTYPLKVIIGSFKILKKATKRKGLFLDESNLSQIFENEIHTLDPKISQLEKYEPFSRCKGQFIGFC